MRKKLTGAMMRTNLQARIKKCYQQTKAKLEKHFTRKLRDKFHDYLWEDTLLRAVVLTSDLHTHAAVYRLTFFKRHPGVAACYTNTHISSPVAILFKMLASVY